MHNGILSVLYGAMVLMKVTHRNNLYYLKGRIVVGEVATVVEKLGEFALDTTRLWHMRLGHASKKALQGLLKQGLLKGTRTCKIDFCEHCVFEKQTRVKFGTTIHQTKGTLDYVHIDMWGPSKVASLGGKHYYKIK